MESNKYNILFLTALAGFVVIVGLLAWFGKQRAVQGDEIESFSAVEGEFEEEVPVLSRFERMLLSRYPDINNWQRPEGPLKVGLQAGHYKNSELPDELENLRGSSLGTSGGGKSEVEVVFKIAEETASLLEERGFEVEILPATVPEGYWADIFVAIHADGNMSQGARGFKASAPWRDLTGRSQDFVDIFYEKYEDATGLPIDPNISYRMRGYYAFNWMRYDHAIHPKTVGAIIETGFLTNPSDQRLLIYQPEVAAQGLAEAILDFLEVER